MLTEKLLILITFLFVVQINMIINKLHFVTVDLIFIFKQQKRVGNRLLFVEQYDTKQAEVKKKRVLTRITTSNKRQL